MVYRKLDTYPHSPKTCTVYLIHFSKPFRHAQHYIGVTINGRTVEERLDEHRRGEGANICKHAVESGIELQLARVWYDVPRYSEQRFKNRGGARRLCPICREQTKV